MRRLRNVCACFMPAPPPNRSRSSRISPLASPRSSAAAGEPGSPPPTRSPWPQPLSIPDLLAAASRLAGEPPDPEGLAHILMATYAAGVIELHSEAAHCMARVSQFPVASQLARSQARRGRLITTTRHTTIEAADEKVRLLLGLLDGAHDFAALARQLGSALQMPEADLAKGIQANLALLADMGVLVA